MTELSAHTLMVAIEAVDARIKHIQSEIDNAVDPELSYLEEEMLGLSKGQMELKRVYIERQKESDNLPSYDELVGDDT